jgi:Cys-tRNA(Pro)/Cys-tRNA(Cys) deacylase
MMTRSASKTNAARLLDSFGISYDLITYDVDPDDLSAETVAKKIGFPEEQVFKTLLASVEEVGHVFAIVPAGAALDAKKLSAAAGGRKADLVALKDVLPLTGYVRGGVTVFGAKKPFPVFADETIELFDAISVSAGVRGTQIIIRAEDYIRATRARLADISKSK